MTNSWVLELPIQLLVAVLEADPDHRTGAGLGQLTKQVVLIYTTGECHEYSIQGFDSKEAAKLYIETTDDEGSWKLEWVFIKGQPARWKEKKIFDFVEVTK